jgi:hypothetical protein
MSGTCEARAAPSRECATVCYTSRMVRMEVCQREVDRVFGDGHAAAHPELVVAIVHAASSDWAARVICAALEDTPRRNAGRSRSLAPVFNPWLSARSTPRLLDSLRSRLPWRFIPARNRPTSVVAAVASAEVPACHARRLRSGIDSQRSKQAERGQKT